MNTRKKGRILEELVARLEKSNLPKDAVIESPKYLKHKITGSRREIDIVVSYH